MACQGIEGLIPYSCTRRGRDSSPSLASAAAAASVVGGTTAVVVVVVVVVFDLQHAKNEKILDRGCGGRSGAVAYFGADLRGPRWAAVVPFGTAFFLGVGVGTAGVV